MNARTRIRKNSETPSDATVAYYRKIAERWLVKHVDNKERERTPKVIVAALFDYSYSVMPSTFRQMRSALLTHQAQYPKAKVAISNCDSVYKVTEEDRKAKIYKRCFIKKKPLCRRVSIRDYNQLFKLAEKRGDMEMVAALVIARLTGARPAEYPNMKCYWMDDGRLAIKIVGVKKRKDRGNNRILILSDEQEKAMKAVQILNGLDGKAITNLKKRASDRAKSLWPKRKLRPTLYSFRHQLSAEIKADESSTRRQLAAVLGHRSQNSANVYGRARGIKSLRKSLPVPSKGSVELVQEELPKVYTKKVSRKSKHQRESSQDLGM